MPERLAKIVARRMQDAHAPACVAVGTIGESDAACFECHCKASRGPLTADAVLEIGSVTKALTGILLADMVVRGEASLDDPVAPETEVTLGELATHTSGLPRLPADFAPPDPDNPYAGLDAAALHAALERTLRTNPGSYAYSNLGYMWLSHALARIAGRPFEALLRERVLAPLGMNDTAITLTEEQQRRFVPGHGRRHAPVPPWDMSPDVAGAGGLRSTLADMMKLAGSVAGRVETPLREAIALAVAPLARADANNAIGLGWYLWNRGGKRIAWHNGGTGGFRSMLAVNLEARTGAVVLSDSGAADFDDLALHLVHPDFQLRRGRLGFLKWW